MLFAALSLQSVRHIRGFVRIKRRAPSPRAAFISANKRRHFLLIIYTNYRPMTSDSERVTSEMRSPAATGGKCTRCSRQNLQRQDLAVCITSYNSQHPDSSLPKLNHIYIFLVPAALSRKFHRNASIHDFVKFWPTRSAGMQFCISMACNSCLLSK